MRVRPVAAFLVVAGLSLIGGGGRPDPPPEAGTRSHGLTVLRPADSLGAVVAGFGDLWVDDRARRRVLRIDGRSGRVVAAIPVAGRVALSAGEDAVWALQSGGGYGLGLRGPVLRIDPGSNRVRARIPLVTAAGDPELGFGVQAAGRAAWVWGPHHILRLRARAGGVTGRIAVADAHGELTGLAATRDQVVAGTADGHIVRFDARTGRRTGMLRVASRKPSPRALIGGLLFYTASGVVGALDLSSGRGAWRRRLGFRAGATLGGDGLLWTYSSALHEPGDRITALRTATGRVVTSGVVPAFGSTGIAIGGGRVSLATAGGQLLVLTPFAA